VPARPAVAYVRVSTQEQGDSGLGLDAQREAIRAYCERAGLDLVDTFEDIASGADDDRPGLAAALELTRRLRRAGGVLVILRHDRLSRVNSKAWSVIEELGDRLHLVDSDGPSGGLDTGVRILLSSHERRLISERTKAALAAKRARGERLGADPQELRERGRAGAASNRKAAQEFAESMRPAFEDCRELNHRQAAAWLNERRIPSATGRPWTDMAVARVRKRLGLA
jgi:DNA invertase Pin-like site-specific DNA recombinase